LGELIHKSSGHTEGDNDWHFQKPLDRARSQSHFRLFLFLFFTSMLNLSLCLFCFYPGLVCVSSIFFIGLAISSLPFSRLDSILDLLMCHFCFQLTIRYLIEET